MGSIPQIEHITPDDEDVFEEENIVKQNTREGTVNQNVAVQIRGLIKTYAGTRNIGCCKCKKTSPFHALKVSKIFPALEPDEVGWVDYNFFYLFIYFYLHIPVVVKRLKEDHQFMVEEIL